MHITPIDAARDTDIIALRELTTIAVRHDIPDLPVPCPIAFDADIREPRHGVIMAREVARDGDSVVGALQVYMPSMDNLGLANIHVTVHPGYRRRGIGSALLRRGLEIARENGRTQIMGGCRVARADGGPTRSVGPQQFCEKHGFEKALTLVNLVLDLHAVDDADEQRLYAKAMEKSADYETISWVNTTPEELLLPLATLQSTFLVEAPMGDLEFEPEAVNLDRSRKNEEKNVRAGVTVFTVAARRRGETEFAAFTRIAVPTNPGDHGNQWMTLASAKHRGHQLGLRIKLENHRQLRKTLPNARYIHTDNAGHNAAMLRVNELLGFQPTDTMIDHKLTLSA